MAGLILPSPRFSQPQSLPSINKSNPITRGLVGFLWVGPGKTADLVNPNIVFTSTGSLQGGPAGIGRVTDVANTGATSGYSGVQGVIAPWKIATKPVTFLAFMGSTPYPVGGSTRVFAGITSGSSGIYVLNLFGADSRAVYCYSSSGVSSNVTTGSWNPGVNIRGLTHDGTTLIGYDSGRQFGTASDATSAIFHDASFTEVKMQELTAGTGYWQAVWGRVLSPVEILSLQVNPWQLLLPITRKLFISAGGASTQTLLPSLFTNSNSIFPPSLGIGGINLAPPLFTNNSTFYTHVVSNGQTLSPSLFVNSSTFYTHTLVKGAVNLVPVLFTNGSTFYTHNITNGNIALIPSLFTNSNSFYPQALVGGLYPRYYGLGVGSSPISFRAISGGTSTQIVLPSLFTNSSIFYTHVVTNGQTLLSNVFANSNTFYAHTLVKGIVNLVPALLINSSIFYTHVVTNGQTLLSNVFANSNTFYAHTLVKGIVNLVPALLINSSIFYTNLLNSGSTIISRRIYYPSNKWATYQPTSRTRSSAPIARNRVYSPATRVVHYAPASRTYHYHSPSRIGT